MTGLLEGRAIAITGAGGGLGRAYALAVAGQGGAVVVGDIDAEAAESTAREVNAIGAQAIAVPGDISDPQVGRTLIRAGVEEFGAMHGLVNNAGISRAGRSWEATDDDVARLLGVNVAGVIATTHAALAHMVPRGEGAIVNVVSGALLGMPGITLYGGTKGAVLGLTYGWAVETDGTGVRVNAISPLARTGMSDLMTDIPDEFKGPPPAAIAPAVIALLADGTAHVTGQVIRFDGVRLGFMSPPAKAPGVEQESWTPARAVEAFAGELRPHLQPLGLGTGKR